jgi:hypothetical protein
MLSWTKHKTTGNLWAHAAKTMLGTAVVHEMPDGRILLDMWKPDQSNIGTGVFPTVDAAKTRAETILDPRATCWDFVNAWCDGDGLLETG